jgi:hypothetical protein
MSHSFLKFFHAIFQKFLLPSARFGGLSGEAGPGTGPPGGQPDYFSGPPNWYTDCQFGATPK